MARLQIIQAKPSGYLCVELLFNDNKRQVVNVGGFIHRLGRSLGFDYSYERVLFELKICFDEDELEILSGIWINRTVLSCI